MSDPAIAASAFANRHLARNHLAHIVAKTRRELGLDRTPTFAGVRRDARGRFVKATA